MQGRPAIKPLHAIGVVFILSFLVYGNSLRNGYSLDDHLVVENNETVKRGFAALPEIFTTPYINLPDVKAGYRPIVKASYALEYQFFGENPHISHFFNVLLYAILCSLIFLVLRLLLKNYNPLLTITAVLLFLFHPVHTEVVCSLKNRDELLSLLFAVGALYGFIRSAQRFDTWFIAGTLCFLLGMMSKTTAVTFAGVIPVTLYFFRQKPLREIFLTGGWLIVIAGIYYGLLFYLFPLEREFHFVEKPISFINDWGVKTATVGYALAYYYKLLVLPHPLGFYYGYNQIPLSTWSEVIPWIGWMVTACLVVYTLYGYFKGKPIAWGLAVFFIIFTLFSNVFIALPGTVSERALFAPSLGFCVALAVLVLKISGIPVRQPKQKGIGIAYIAILLPLLISGGFKTFDRNKDWYSHLSLYEADIDFLKNSAKAHQLYANKMREIYTTTDPSKKQEFLPKVIHHYQRSIEIYKKWYQSQFGLAMVYAVDLNQPEKAIPHLRIALKDQPHDFKAAFNLARCFQLTGNADSARYYFEKTVELNPSHLQALHQLFLYYYKKGMIDKAYRYSDWMLQRYPGVDLPYINFGALYALAGDTLTAISYYEKAVEKNPQNAAVLQLLRDYYRKQGNKEKEVYFNMRLSGLNSDRNPSDIKPPADAGKQPH